MPVDEEWVGWDDKIKHEVHWMCPEPCHSLHKLGEPDEDDQRAEQGCAMSGMRIQLRVCESVYGQSVPDKGCIVQPRKICCPDGQRPLPPHSAIDKELNGYLTEPTSAPALALVGEFQRVGAKGGGHGGLLGELHLDVVAVVDHPASEENVIVGCHWAPTRKVFAEAKDVLVGKGLCKFIILDNFGADQT